MAESVPGRQIAGRSPRRGLRLLAAIAVAALAAAYPLAVGSTHLALSVGDIGWSGPVAGHAAGLGPMTQAETAQVESADAYRSLLWATRPGGEVSFGFALHNGGIMPVTVLGLAPLGFGRGVVHDLAPAGALLGPDWRGRTRPFHPVTLGPGSTVAVGLTERVVCDPIIRDDALHLGAGRSVLGDATSPVVVRYRVLGLPTTQTLTLRSPVLVSMLYRACA